jgi:hypothetical protein
MHWEERGGWAEQGAPAHLRSDNGPELIAREMKRYLERRGTGATWSFLFNP